MRGYIGVSEELEPGLVLYGTGHKITVIGLVTEEEARESAAAMGHDLVLVPGEKFYEVEFTTVPMSGNN